MDNTKTPNLTEEKQYRDANPVEQRSKKPDDLSGLNIEAKIKIWEPETGNVIIEGRA